MNEKEIEHPEAQGKMSETLLAADMAALASEKGRKKILTIREIDPSCIKNDLDTITEYKKVGIDLKQGEAALISGFESAFQAKNMIKSEQDRKWIEKIIEQSLKGDYSFEGKKITIKEAFAKLRDFNEAVKKSKTNKEQLSSYGN